MNDTEEWTIVEDCEAIRIRSVGILEKSLFIVQLYYLFYDI